jgi:hypothetical protein
MEKFLHLSKESIQTNSPLWQIGELEGEQVIRVIGNVETDQIGGKVALIGVSRRDYSMQAELKFLGHHLGDQRAGWFGLVMRARDMENYELVWFMPQAEGGKTVAYVPVAHGIVPWWTEAYANQQKGAAHIPNNAWFRTRVEVLKDEMSIYVEDRLVFTKKLTYYLSQGFPGLYVGTATDAAFRRIVIEDLS